MEAKEVQGILQSFQNALDKRFLELEKRLLLKIDEAEKGLGERIQRVKSFAAEEDQKLATVAELSRKNIRNDLAVRVSELDKRVEELASAPVADLYDQKSLEDRIRGLEETSGPKPSPEIHDSAKVADLSRKFRDLHTQINTLNTWRGTFSKYGKRLDELEEKVEELAGEVALHSQAIPEHHKKLEEADKLDKEFHDRITNLGHGGLNTTAALGKIVARTAQAEGELRRLGVKIGDIVTWSGRVEERFDGIGRVIGDEETGKRVEELFEIFEKSEAGLLGRVRRIWKQAQDHEDRLSHVEKKVDVYVHREPEGAGEGLPGFVEEPGPGLRALRAYLVGRFSFFRTALDDLKRLTADQLATIAEWGLEINKELRDLDTGVDGLQEWARDHSKRVDKLEAAVRRLEGLTGNITGESVGAHGINAILKDVFGEDLAEKVKAVENRAETSTVGLRLMDIRLRDLSARVSKLEPERKPGYVDFSGAENPRSDEKKGD